MRALRRRSWNRENPTAVAINIIMGKILCGKADQLAVSGRTKIHQTMTAESRAAGMAHTGPPIQEDRNKAG